MDTITVQDRAVSTETPRRNQREEKDIEHLKKSASSLTLTKTEKKKSESKKLKKKLVAIEEQNESLTKMMQDKNSEIVELRKSVNSLNEILNSVPIDELRCNSSIAGTKLLELCKKNRQLRAELETTKNRLNKKDVQIKKLEKDLKMVEEKFHQDVDLMKKGNILPVDEFQSKISALQQKLFETRNKNVELNTQLKLAQKCLQQEIGEHFNLNLLASQASNSNWRGRAQQILHLQQKIQELKERLDGYEQNIGMSPYNLPNTQGGLICNPLLPSNGSFTSFERPNVRKTEIQHRAKVETLEKEISSLNSQLEEYRVKLVALKVRNKTLNDEISRCKLKANTLEEQTDFNNINVASMNDKLNQQKLHYEKQIDELKRELKNLVKQREDMSLNEEHMREKMEELTILIASKDEHIEELNKIVKKLEDDLKALCGGFLFSCREFRKEEFITILDSLEVEKNSLLEHNKTLTERIDQERNKNDNLQEQISKQKIRISRLESKVRDLERELETQNEKKKRSQRIAEYANNLSTMSSSTSLCSFTFENSTHLNTAKSYGEDSMEDNIIDLKNRLELSTEKITLLKEKLDYITTEKENDLKTFQQIFNNTKNILLESIQAQRNKNHEEDPN